MIADIHPVEKESACISKSQFLKELDRLPANRDMQQMFAGPNCPFGDWWKEAEQGNGMYIVTFAKPSEESPCLSYIKIGMEMLFFKGHYRFKSILKNER